jgi:thiamine biosynthesis lipoprotein
VVTTHPVADPAAEVSSTRWEVWGTYAFVALSDARRLPAAHALAAGVIADVDATCSRFRADSDLSRVNRRPGQWVAVDPLLVGATRVALAAAEATDGLVDPCLGQVIVSLGYDTDLATFVRRPSPVGARPVAPVPDAWRRVECEEDAIWIPEGVSLDLGATAKAWAADLVAETIVEELGCETVVSLGGDVRVLGPDSDRPAQWPVLVAEHPDDLASAVAVTVTGGLATSSTVVRRWRSGGVERHHLIDPRTGFPVPETYRTVSAGGHTCVAANTASTAALVLGAAAPDWLRHHGITARLVAADGTVSCTDDWPTATPGETGPESGGAP